MWICACGWGRGYRISSTDLTSPCSYFTLQMGTHSVTLRLFSSKKGDSWMPFSRCAGNFLEQLHAHRALHKTLSPPVSTQIGSSVSLSHLERNLECVCLPATLQSPFKGSLILKVVFIGLICRLCCFPAVLLQGCQWCLRVSAFSSVKWVTKEHWIRISMDNTEQYWVPIKHIEVGSSFSSLSSPPLPSSSITEDRQCISGKTTEKPYVSPSYTKLEKHKIKNNRIHKIIRSFLTCCELWWALGIFSFYLSQSFGR